MHEITLTEAEAGQRFDRYLRKLLHTMPLAAIFKRLRSGDLRIDGKKADGSVRLTAGMKVQLRLPEADLAVVATAAPRRGGAAHTTMRIPSELKPRLVHKDDDVLVISKPPGLAVQPGTGRENEHLVAWLDQQRLGTRSATFAPSPAHRLDRGTSGLVAIGLTPEGLRGLTAAFRDDLVQKIYLAVVHGVPAEAKGTIDAPLLVRTDAGKKEPKVVVDAAGKAARTDYEVLQRGRKTALLRLVLHTGRTHQIRAHLAHLGHPIVGDERYGSKASHDDGFLLHAAELTFPHPRSGEPVHCIDEPPESFAAAVR